MYRNKLTAKAGRSRLIKTGSSPPRNSAPYPQSVQLTIAPSPLPPYTSVVFNRVPSAVSLVVIAFLQFCNRLRCINMLSLLHYSKDSGSYIIHKLTFIIFISYEIKFNNNWIIMLLTSYTIKKWKFVLIQIIIDMHKNQTETAHTFDIFSGRKWIFEGLREKSG